MTAQEIINAIEEACERYEYVGLRFEDMERSVGDVCSNSKDNPERQDERDFPDYNDPEYDNLPELDGTCAWICGTSMYGYSDCHMAAESSVKVAAAQNSYAMHCYVVASDHVGSSDWHVLDDGEILLIDPVVTAVIY